MNHKFILTICLSLILMTACVPVVEPTQPVTGQTDFVKSKLERITAYNINQEEIQSLAQENTRFALSFYDQIRNQSGNIIFSPISLSLALSMTMAGAEGATEEGMRTALQFSSPEPEIHPTFNALLLSIENSMTETNETAEGSEFQLNIINSLWGQSGFDFKDDFLDKLAQYYGAGLYQVDYQGEPEAARQAINAWVEKETNNKIEDLVPEGALNSLTRLVLANAIYFKGSWFHPFSESGTEKAPFTTLDGDEITVQMMKLHGERLFYAKGDDFQAVSLPYLSTDFEMTLIVPDAGAFSGYENTLTPQQIADILSRMTSEEVNLNMPKFDFESSINAKEPLEALGMGDAFQMDTADFSGITEAENLYISDVLHKATITVDEKGTEAAAATAVIVGETSAMPGEPISLVIDRPFIFFIRHIPTSSILFIGRVSQP